jgi:hypothetical protein
VGLKVVIGGTAKANALAGWSLEERGVFSGKSANRELWRPRSVTTAWPKQLRVPFPELPAQARHVTILQQVVNFLQSPA